MKAVMLLIGGAIVGLLAIHPWGVVRAQGALASWEHTCLTGSTGTNRVDSALAQLKAQSDKLGQQGWELVAVATPPDRLLMCFKRQAVAK